MHISSHTALRGLASLAVLWGHYTNVFARDVAGIDFFLPHTHIGVDLFFILSGFILFHLYASSFASRVTLGNWAGFMRRRLLRIYPLHLATLLIVLISMRFHLPEGGLYQLILHLTLTHAWGTTDSLFYNSPSWSISAEFAAYLVFPFLAWLMGLRFGPVVLVGLVLVCGVRLIGLAAGSLDLELIGVENIILRVAMGFPIGILLAWGITILPALSNRLAGVLQIGAVGLGAGWLALGGAEIAMILPMAVLTFATARDQGPLAAVLRLAPLQWLGRVSYGVYLLQWPVILVFFNLAPWLQPHFPGLTFDLARLVIVMTMLFVAADLSWRWFEGPISRIGRRLDHKE